MEYDVTFDTGRAESRETDLIVYLVPQDGEGSPRLDDLPSLPEEPLDEFEGEREETRVFYEGEFEARKLALIGLGDEEDLELPQLADVAGTVPGLARDESAGTASLVYPMFLDVDRDDAAKFLGMGLKLGGYEFDEFKTEEDDEDDADENEEPEELTLLLEDRRSLSTVRDGAERAEALSSSVERSRDLANTPANHLVPADLAEEARTMAEEYEDVSVTVWDEEDLADDDMNLILAVGKGSENPPRLVRLDYEPDDPGGTVGVVGKGVTFDTGGISIKPSKKMGEMKFDMCGAATVLGVVQACAKQNLPVTVYGLVPTAENMPSDRAVKPGDVVTGYHGKSVEILNTDAEGRLLLADALGYASDEFGEELDQLIDFATLTGACITALGHHAAALMGNDEALREELEEAGQSTEEPVWPLPLWEEYSEKLESDVADVKNIGGKAGTITAGAFLREFVDEDEVSEWAHFDIAGTGWGMAEKSYRPSGGTGFGVHLIDEYLREEY